MARYTLISAEDAEESFGISEKIDYPYQDFEDEQEIRLYDGDLVLTSDFTSDATQDWNPFNVIVDGDLTVRGNIDWQDWGSGCFLFVTGNVVAENVTLRGCPNIHICGSLRVRGAIFGTQGDDGGVLRVEGSTKAELIVSLLYFSMDFEDDVNAMVIGSPDLIQGCKVDAPADDCEEYFLPDFLDEDGAIEEEALLEAILEGAPYLRND
ncbi:MAG: hypothetical protein H6728_00365 [Myxococcales bacterium]|nr:hypothetical protein [Myxococcales bacterium]MCB9641516.1 hypothetical protein [Myxococcales bacterium]